MVKSVRALQTVYHKRAQNKESKNDVFSDARVCACARRVRESESNRRTGYYRRGEQNEKNTHSQYSFFLYFTIMRVTCYGRYFDHTRTHAQCIWGARASVNSIPTAAVRVIRFSNYFVVTVLARPLVRSRLLIFETVTRFWSFQSVTHVVGTFPSRPNNRFPVSETLCRRCTCGGVLGNSQREKGGLDNS